MVSMGACVSAQKLKYGMTIPCLTTLIIVENLPHNILSTRKHSLTALVADLGFGVVKPLMCSSRLIPANGACL